MATFIMRLHCDPLIHDGHNPSYWILMCMCIFKRHVNGIRNGANVILKHIWLIIIGVRCHYMVKSWSRNWLLLVWDVTIWSNYDHEIHRLPWWFLWGYIHASYIHATHWKAKSMIQVHLDTFLVSKVIIRFKFEPEFKMSAIYAMLNLHGFLFLQVTYMWHKGGSDLKPKPIVFVLFLWSYNKAYFRFILEFKIVVYHNVGIW